MVTNPTKIRLPQRLEHEIDWRKASQCIDHVGDRIIVEMLPEDRPTTILIPDSLREFLRSHDGVVLSSPANPYELKGVSFDAPSPGDLVIVHPQDGVKIINAEMGDYTPANEIRIYGAFAEYVGQPIAINWWDSILASIDKDKNMRAYGDKTIFRKDSANSKTSTGIHLPDGHHERNEMAVIVSRGPLAHPDAKEGDRVSYNPHYVEQNGVDLGTGVNDFDYFIAGDLAINYVVRS